MDAASILTHVARIAYGIGATVACAAIFQLGGLALSPRSWDGRLTRGAHAFLGAAVYVMLCWFGVSLDTPVAATALGFASGVVLLAGLRYRRISSWLADRAARRGALARAAAAFALLYVLAYLFTLPPADSAFLPLAWGGNIDLMTYVRYTRYLMTLGPSNVAGFSYMNYVYLQTPGLFHLLGGLSLLFGRDPLTAAMPVQFALVALIGTMTVAISREVFGLSFRAAFAIACIFISGPFFRYVSTNYFLSTLMAMPVMLGLLWTTVVRRPERAIDLPLGVSFGAMYIPLLFIYPFLLFASIGLQLGAVVLRLIAELQRGAGAGVAKAAFRTAASTLLTATTVLAAIAAAFWSHLAWSLWMVGSLSEKGVAGWPLDLISPQAMFGWPGAAAGAMQVPPESQARALVVFGLISAGLAVAYFWRRLRVTPEQGAFAGLLSGAIVLYGAYFSMLGPSYQQWKFASYTVLPLSFVAFALSLRLLQESALLARLAPSTADRRLLTALPAFVAVALVAGNAAAHAAFDPALRRLPVSLRGIAKVDELPNFREITVRMNDVPDPLPTWVALYYLPNKKVHVVSSRFTPSVPLRLDLITRQRPLLVHNFGCEGVGHDDTLSLAGVGCLLYAPPTLQKGVGYPFNRSFLFVSYQNMTAREPGGRWNTGPTMPFKILADPEKNDLNRDTYLNFFVNPFLPDGVGPQTLVFRWGGERRAETQVATEQWISVPVRTGDWTGNRLWEIGMSIDFPDGRTILFHEWSLTDEPRGTVAPRAPDAGQ